MDTRQPQFYRSSVGLTQTPLSGSAAVLVGLGAFGVVAFDATWQVLKYGTVMAHEGAHAVMDSLLFREWDGTELNLPDADRRNLQEEGRRLSRHRHHRLYRLRRAQLVRAGRGAANPDRAYRGRVVGDAFPPRAPRLRAPLVLRRDHGPTGDRPGVCRWPVHAGGVQIVAAYAIAWFLLLSGVRGILRRCAPGQATGKDSKDSLAFRSSSGLPLWLAATLAAVAVGGKMLVMPT